MRGVRNVSVVLLIVFFILILPSSRAIATVPPQEQYQAAVALFNQKKPEARAAFLAIVSASDTQENRLNIEFDTILGGSNYYIGETYFQEDKHADAAPYYQEVISAFQSFKAESYYHLGLGKFYQQDFPGAVSTLGDLALRFPFSPLAPQAMYYQGTCKQLMKDKVGAAATFREMVQRCPQHAWSKKAREKMGQ